MYLRGPTGTAASSLVPGTPMHLYTAVPSRSGRPTVVLPQRAGRAVLTLPRRGPISATCRCGQQRAAHEHQLPGRDCARCSAPLVR